MEKFKRWLLLIFCSLFILLFATVFIVLLPDLFKTGFNHKDSYLGIFAMLVLTVLSILGFRDGLKKVKTAKKNIPAGFDKILDIKFGGRIEYKDYRKFIFNSNFRGPKLLFLIGIYFILIINLITVKDSSVFQSDTFYLVLWAFLIFILSPVLIIYLSKKIYKSSRISHEYVNYSLDNNSLIMSGETFSSEMKWAHFYKVRETKDFFVLYQGKTVANLICKKFISSERVNELRAFVKSINLLKE